MTDLAHYDPTALARPDRNPAVVYLASLGSDASRRTMRTALDQIAAMVSDGTLDALAMPWERMRFAHTAAIRAGLAQRYSPAWANVCLAALRAVLGVAFDLGLMDAEDHARAVRVRGVRGARVPAGRDLSEGEVRALVAVCMNDPTPAGPRDAAILGLGVACGLRRAEIVALDLSDYDCDPDGGRLVVRGKGNKERTAYARGGTADALMDWLAVRGDREGALFHPVNRGGKIERRRMTAQAVYAMLRRRTRQANVADCSPHDLRRTFVSNLLDAGADISVVQQLAGHASVETTQRYDRRGERTKRRAAGLLHFPYRRRLV